MHSCRLSTTILLLFLFSLNNGIDAENADENVIIGGDNVVLRDKPGLDSKILHKLKLGQIVSVLNKSKIEITINSIKGHWVFVDTRIIMDSSSCNNTHKESLKGWVFDYYLYFKNNFTKVNNCTYKNIGVTCDGGDIYFQFIFNNDGSFIMKDAYQLGSHDEHEKYCKESFGVYKKSEPGACYHEGQLYKFNKIIWAKLDKVPYGGNEYFYITDSNQLLYVSNTLDYGHTEIIK